ncbi:hypothetical protein SAMN05216464_115131 [Mucilaginibacter pineti]|uniref:Uncharacterized protein n=1 Tax=Mucilaginibacter pineti TaxID=1391627 RepID=A0A1G7JVJ7_9SPHI|nr:hypothetical protein [Mucilaginibacter pineti]SDF28968.1 hypothetical protein SAMN05216464_115131 [Mucilaginibacter pineti]
MKKKSYKITFALKEGYSPKGKVYDLDDAVKVIRCWMEKRLKDNKPVLSGLLQEGQLFFPAPESSKETVTVSSTAVYCGELSSTAELKRKNKEIRSTLESLAGELKAALRQESVFIIYRDDNWCI